VGAWSTLRVSFLYPVFIFGFIPAIRLLHTSALSGMN
jgi:hypothetical protein